MSGRSRIVCERTCPVAFDAPTSPYANVRFVPAAEAVAAAFNSLHMDLWLLPMQLRHNWFSHSRKFKIGFNKKTDTPKIILEF